VWKGQEIRGIGEWIMNRAKIPVKEYEKLAEQFNPVKFNADEWVQIAKDAGQKYMVITSKHHDGFAMYHSLASKYNVVDATPFKRDVCKELADACARNDMRLGFYYSQAQDWHEPNGIGNTWDFGPDDKKDFDEYFNGKAIPQVREILTGYGPVCLVWFDTPKNVMTEERSMKLKNVVHELRPACLIDGRIGKAGADYQSTGDNKIPDAVKPGDWETPATLNDTWGFKTNDNNWKSGQPAHLQSRRYRQQGRQLPAERRADERGPHPAAQRRTPARDGRLAEDQRRCDLRRQANPVRPGAEVERLAVHDEGGYAVSARVQLAEGWADHTAEVADDTRPRSHDERSGASPR
jgi:hypothetical protein